MATGRSRSAPHRLRARAEGDEDDGAIEGQGASKRGGKASGAGYGAAKHMSHLSLGPSLRNPVGGDDDDGDDDDDDEEQDDGDDAAEEDVEGGDTTKVGLLRGPGGGLQGVGQAASLGAMGGGGKFFPPAPPNAAEDGRSTAHMYEDDEEAAGSPRAPLAPRP